MIISSLLALAEPAVTPPVVHPATAATAPELQVDHWLPAAPTVGSRAVLVEVWATWCGPCRDSFPMLAKLQSTYPDTLTVVALTDERLDLVTGFVADHAELQSVHVAIAPESTTQALLFGGFEGRGIPSAYLIIDSQVVWSGTPENAREAVTSRLKATAPSTKPPAR